MTTFNLVVQSPALASDLIEQAAALSEASGVQRISTTAARLLKVNDSESVRAELRAWGEQVSVDTAYSKSPQLPKRRCVVRSKIFLTALHVVWPF